MHILFPDIYREAFESTKKTEEAKFKVRFDNLLSDLTKSIEKQSPTDEHIPDDIGDNSCEFSHQENMSVQ